MENKELMEQQAQAVQELRTAVESGTKLTDEKIEALKSSFLEGEKANKKLVADIEAQKAELETQKEVTEELEKKLTRLPAGTDQSEKQDIIKSFERYIKELPLKERNFVFTAEEAKYLRTDSADNGGVLVPEILADELIKEEIEVSPVLENSRVINATAKSISYPIRTTIPSTNRPGEGGTSTKSNPKYELKRLEAYRNDAIVPATREILKFAGFNMRQQIMSDAALSLAEQTNIDFISGDGVSKSEGILTNTDVAELNSGIANNIELDNFFEIQKKDNIKSVYKNNGKFYMNSNTLFDLLQRKDGQGAYLWNQNIALGLPNTIGGRPYIDTPNMPDIGANTFPVFFGDLRRAYYILRDVGVELIIDPYSQKEQGIIEYMWVEFIGGKVVLAEAIVKLKCAV